MLTLHADADPACTLRNTRSLRILSSAVYALALACSTIHVCAYNYVFASTVSNANLQTLSSQNMRQNAGCRPAVTSLCNTCIAILWIKVCLRLMSRPEGCVQPSKLWFSTYSCIHLHLYTYGACLHTRTITRIMHHNQRKKRTAKKERRITHYKTN